MRNRTSAFALGCSALSLLLFANCRQRGAEEFAANLPELPPNLAATLDPKTLATKISTSHPDPEKEPGIALAPCCASKDTKSLKVNFSYTKCGPLRDFIVAPIGDLVLFDPGQGGGGQGAGRRNVRAYRLKEVNRKSVLDTTVCVTSEGPWNATLMEDRFCNGYTPHDTLIINAFGDVVSFVWNGGPPNHPSQVHVVSCREIGVVRYPCGGLSDCPCSSSPCPADQPCDCGLLW